MNKKIFYRRIVTAIVALTLIMLLMILGFSYYTVRQFAYCKPVSDEDLTIVSKRYCQLMELGAEDIKLTTRDGITLTGLFIPRHHAKRAIILCHGYRMSKERMTRIARMFPHDSLLLFDFRGHGCSTGDIISLGCHEVVDIFAAVDFIRNNSDTKDLPLIGIGVSMGGASLIAATAQGAPFEALIIDSSFARLHEQITHRFKTSTGLPTIPFMLPTIWLFEHTIGCPVETISPVDAIQEIKCPILIIHSLDDEFTPVHQAHQLYAAAHEPKKLWLVPSAKHGFISKDYNDEYEERIHEFLAEHRL